MKKPRLLLSGIIFLFSFAINAQCYWQNPSLISNQTTIEFSLTKSEDVTLSIYDITGKLIEVILSKKMQQGEHKICWNSTMMEKGIYFFELKTNPAETGQTTKMIKL